MGTSAIHKSDSELVDRLKQGDNTAFTQLYDQYHRAVYFYILDYVKAPQVAEDLVHDVFMKIWEIREGLTITTSFSSYLYRICHNKAIDALQKIAKDEKLRQEVLQWIEPQLQEKERNLQEHRAVYYERIYQEAISALSPQRQRVFLLCREQGKTYEEAAAELGISRNTVKEHMGEALHFLRNYLLKKGELAFVMIILGKIL